MTLVGYEKYLKMINIDLLIIQIRIQEELGLDEIVSDEIAKDWVVCKYKLPALKKPDNYKIYKVCSVR